MNKGPDNRNQYAKAGKILSLLLFAGIVITIWMAFLSPSDQRINIFGLSLVVTLFLTERFLYVLNRYMSTFPISPNFARNIRIARNSLFVLIPVFILFYILYYLWSPTSSGMVTLGVLFGVVCIIAAVCGIVFYVAFLLAGKCILNLYTTEQDERIKTAGKLMFYGALFPVSWFFVPLLTYKLFAEAS